MIQRDIYTPLFTDKSTSVYSPFFYVFPGYVVQALAFGFLEKATRSGREERQVPQMACLEQALLYEDVKVEMAPTDKKSCPCPKLYNLSTEVLEVEELNVNGCSFSLSACNNQMLINLPGTYRFVLNDQTALGVARVYLRMYSKDDFPWTSQLLIGADS